MKIKDIKITRTQKIILSPIGIRKTWKVEYQGRTDEFIYQNDQYGISFESMKGTFTDNEIIIIKKKLK